MKMPEKEVVHKPWKGASDKTNPANTLTFDLCLPKFYLSHLVCGTCFCNPGKLIDGDVQFFDLGNQMFGSCTP